MKPEEMERNAARVARLLKAMGNPNRLMILCQLSAGERSVGALAGAVGLSQSALSQHLAKLREDGLVTTRRQAQSVLYSLSSEEVRTLIDVLYGLFCRVPAGREPGGAATG
jgi:DNA-binding transcriptional ArsR family regulator